MIVGIDFGTCFSSAAIMSGLIPVTNYASDTNEGIPSLFMFSKETGKELYGIDCTKREAVENEDDVVRYMKRLVRADPDSLGTTILRAARSTPSPRSSRSSSHTWSPKSGRGPWTAASSRTTGSRLWRSPLRWASPRGR